MASTRGATARSGDEGDSPPCDPVSASGADAASLDGATVMSARTGSSPLFAADLVPLEQRIAALERLPSVVSRLAGVLEDIIAAVYDILDIIGIPRGETDISSTAGQASIPLLPRRSTSSLASARRRDSLSLHRQRISLERVPPARKVCFLLRRCYPRR